MGSWSHVRLPLRPGKLRFGRWLWLLGLALACRKVAGVVLDLPPQPAPGVAQSVPSRGAAGQPALDTLRPPVEAMADSDSVRALLPKDRNGNIDWAAALRQGIIRPRADLPGAAPSARLQGFRYDFVFKGSTGALDALFPHSTHVEWLNCESCHPQIFRYPNEPVTMADIEDGKYCGECHGKVAFPTATACDRCHVGMPPQPGATPEFLGEVVLARSQAGASQTQAAQYPPARFSHWVHRIRYRCSACHPGPFTPRAGADTLTMASMRGGEACGRCHDGRSAFALMSCARCHHRQPGP